MDMSELCADDPLNQTSRYNSSRTARGLDKAAIPYTKQRVHPEGHLM